MSYRLLTPKSSASLHSSLSCEIQSNADDKSRATNTEGEPESIDLRTSFVTFAKVVSVE